MNNLINDGGTQEYTNGTGSAIAVGAPVDLTDRVGIAAVALANGATGTVYTKGVFKLAKNPNTDFVAGADVDWDSSESRCDELGDGESGDLLNIGKAMKATAASAAYVDVEINVPVTMSTVA